MRRDPHETRFSFALLIAIAVVALCWTIAADLRSGLKRLVRSAWIAAWFTGLALGAVVAQWGEWKMRTGAWTITRAIGACAMAAGSAVIIVVWLLPILLGRPED